MRGAPRKTSREAVLDEARTLFAKRGVASTSIADIALACGIAKGTFYRYFESKEALVDALFLPEAEELALLVTRGGAKPTVREMAVDLLAFFQARPLFLAELRVAYRGRAQFSFVERATSCFVPMMKAWYRRDARYEVGDLDLYSELVAGAVLDLCCWRTIEGRLDEDGPALVMLQDLMKRFFDCEP
jgi:AcrR family transcriptional regulator